MVLFEIPTGSSRTAGAARLFPLRDADSGATTGLYVLLWQLHSRFVWWAIVSATLGLGYTFFSGATDAWLVDALTATRFEGQLEGVFARAQVVIGATMLIGSVAGGYLAQLTNLGVPYLARAAILIGMFGLALIMMHDSGFHSGTWRRPVTEMKKIVNSSVEHGLKVPAIRASWWLGCSAVASESMSSTPCSLTC
jgi:MFS family permease